MPDQTPQPNQTAAPQPATPPNSTSTTVPMFSPDGSLGDVPAERVHDAVKSGFKLGQDLISPDGQAGTVPLERVHDAIQQGFKLKGGLSPAAPGAFQTKPGGPIQNANNPLAETPSTFNKVEGTAERYAGKALSAAGLPTSISNIPEWFQHLTGTHPDSKPWWEPIKNAIKNPTQENIVAAVPFIGPASVSMAKDVREGDYGGAAATLAGTLAMPKVAETQTAVAKAALGKAGQVSDAVAQKMYQSTLKPGPRSYTAAEVEQMVKTGLENKIPVSQAGIERLDTLVADLNDKIANEIKAGSAQGATVNKFDVARRLGQTAKKFETQVNPEADLNAVGEAGNEFLRNQPTEIPAAEAQALKTGTYRQLGDKAYGELKSATIESQKALARGIKEEIADQFPEIADLNAKESKLLGLDEALDDAVNRTRNRNVVSLGGKVLASKSMGLAVLHEVLGLPSIQSRIAIGISRASKIPFPEALTRVGAYVNAINVAGSTQDTSREDASQPWVKIKTSDGKLWEIHPGDVGELQRRDPGVKILDQPQP